MIECLKEGMIIEGLMHDLSKFSLLEFKAYANHFYGKNRDMYTYISHNGYSKDDDPIKDIDFDIAWVHHIHHNPHHWQYWVVLENEKQGVILEMPRKYMVEMICDWIGAAKAQGDFRRSKLKLWYNINKNKIILAQNTRKWIEYRIKSY
ncbi:MAG TPA: DUF5662 family protein [Bacteroidales bacterium]|nr:DUF5662 family protein [Bacteroidales bacterium]